VAAEIQPCQTRYPAPILVIDPYNLYERYTTTPWSLLTPPSVRRKVFSDIEKLKENPRPHGVEKMETKDKLYRIYVGRGKNYRAIYQIRDEALLILVVKVGDRKDVYRRVK
jgi:mRNA interferase RelE/StbE